MSALIAHVPRRFAADAWGGTERLVTECARELARRGFASRVVTTRVMCATPEETIGGVAIERHPHFYPIWPLSTTRRAGLDRKGGNVVSFALARALARTPDLAVVHLHTGNRLGAQALAVARRRGVPCVISLHGGHFAIPAAERADLSSGGAGRRRGLDWGRALSWWWKSRRLLDHVDAVICVGHEEYEAAASSLPRQRVRFLPGAVDVDAFANGDRARGRAMLGVDPGRELVVAISRIDRQKDLATLVQAWAATGRDTCDLALVGPETSPGYGEELRRLGSGAAGRLLMPGNIAAASVPDLLAGADLSVLPSRHEPFGLAVLESWAAGTAVIAAAVGGPAWLLAGESCGRLFPPGDHVALSALLRDQLDHPERRRALAEAGRRRANAEFTWRHHVDRLLTIYAEAGMARAG